MLFLLAKRIYNQGIEFIPYLDDCLMLAKSREVLQSHVAQAVSFLQEAGFLINAKKSFLSPVQDLVFLGFRFRTDLGTVHLPLEKAQTVSECAGTFLVGSSHPAGHYLRFLGLMASCFTVLPYG